MSKMSHITVIERYEEHRSSIRNLLGSILTCFADEKMLELPEMELMKSLNSLNSYYPFVSLFYRLDPEGVQTCVNIPGPACRQKRGDGLGIDRSKRPYYRLARDASGVAITEPYLSSFNRELCISAIQQFRNDEGAVTGYVVLDIDLGAALAFLIGDSRRRHFEPYFKFVYGVIAAGLFGIVLALLYIAGKEFVLAIVPGMGPGGSEMMPFGLVIYLTLSLAIFDLGKTILEEEVLLYKDIYRHSSTRRTITRFIAVIIIAVSIEALLMIFKAALGGHREFMLQAVWVIVASAVLLLCLGGYVFLGSHAENNLLRQRKVRPGQSTLNS